MANIAMVNRFNVTLSTSTITPQQAPTIPRLFRARVADTPHAVAYRYYDSVGEEWKNITWQETADRVACYQMALQNELVQAGDRVAIMSRNCLEWFIFDQAAMGLGLVVVPLYSRDRADNATYILNNCAAKILLIDDQEQWLDMKPKMNELPSLQRVISIKDINDSDEARLSNLSSWVSADNYALQEAKSTPDQLATIIYTSGTTGHPKGVMLSHKNLLSNAYAGLCSVVVNEQHLFLSFLPLSHALERTVGYYLPMMCGATVAIARGIPELADDLLTIRPTHLIAVPRIFERIHSHLQQSLCEKSSISRCLFKFAITVGWRRFEYQQGRLGYSPLLLLWWLLDRLVAVKLRKKLGGNLQTVICGGASLAPDIAKVFISLGVPILHGYGLTEASPCISTNRLQHNIPASVGIPLPGVQVRIAEKDELLVKADSVMLGYWQLPKENTQIIDQDGWLHTGDQARFVEEFIYIVGRLKEIIILANGEKIPPADMELAIISDPLFEQILIIGEGRPYLSAIAVLEAQQWQRYARSKHFLLEDYNTPAVEQALLKRIAYMLHCFPGYAKIRRLKCIRELWTVEQGLLTPTLKIRRQQVCLKYREEIDAMYIGHGA